MRDMYEVLDRWGAWAAADNSGVDWQPVAAGFKGLLPHGKKTRQQCDDDEGIMIDSCVARLRKYKPEEYELVIAHFIIGISLREGANKQVISSQADSLIKISRIWADFFPANTSNQPI